jgi:uncharacterized lipoprotein
MNMKLIFFCLLLTLIAACSLSKEQSHPSDYSLEQPPSVSITSAVKKSKEQDISSDSDKSFNKELSVDVHRNEDNDQVLWIMRPIDETWTLLSKAIRLMDLEVTGINRKQGTYEVEYQGDSLLGEFNVFGSGSSAKYILKLEPQDKETKLSVSKKEGDHEMDESLLKDGTSEFLIDNSSKLADILFEALQKN